MHLASAGRTGRFGRKGISINFVHDKATWQQMEEIERATGKQIIRIETNDLDAMEEVRVPPSCFRGSVSISITRDLSLSCSRVLALVLSVHVFSH